MKVKIIARGRYDHLQSVVNEWLHENRNLEIIDIKYSAGNQYANDPEYSAMIIYNESK
ncbi:sporulation protein Cse60 [Oceanirhabdus sp. W0125-5]|uniref:sporulation protein Cse60 n=1 Tax=Oceanirhabdus sp. W0125-5 TaxID=2999116 RepID=UPI0022F3415E|nr:sporulation protein Cse60 [Oceanirhabdus sp. W0125-5]WBW98577.1 sporulation protein Cse60 [Oceanirhabdus sp. W0125-5]